MNANQPKLTNFFCIGSAKSGTTLLARVLDQHPQIACIWESYALNYRARTSIFNPASDNWQKHGYQRADVEGWAKIWRAEPQAFLRRGLKRLTGKTFFARAPLQKTLPPALADFARRCNAVVVGDKWPAYIKHIQTVLAVFPKAKFIYNVRDPRGLWNLAQNFKNRNRGDELLMQMLDNDAKITPYLSRPNFITLRYEDLVAHPHETCRKLYTFLGCDFSEDYLAYNPKTVYYPERWDWVPEAKSQFDIKHTVKWKEKMDLATINRVTKISARFMEKYNYE